MAVVSDKKLPVDANEDGTIDYYTADIIKATDYAPLGMGLVDRSFNAESYRYGFNGKENEEETGTQDYGMRIYDNRLGKFLSVDPLAKKYPWYTPFQFAGNTPIEAVDLDGKEPLRPKLLTNDLKWYQPILKTWNYMALLPSDRAEGGYELQSMGSSKAVVWDYEYIAWTGSRTFQHTEDITWVMYNGTFYNANGLNNISPSILEGKETWEEYWGRQQMSQNSLNKASERAATAVAIGQLVSGFKNIYQGLKMMKAANAARASVDDKLARYLLNPNHPIGRSKAKWFKEALGFSIKNADDLAKQIIFDANKAVSKGNTKGFGEMFEQIIDITGANGKKISVQFNFIIKEGEDFARLVGALPTKK